MKIELKHTFLAQAYDLEGLLKGCEKLSTFCSRLVKQSEKHPDRHDPFKYRGDGFELFTEALIKLSPADNRIGVFNYEPVLVDDTGADGVGIGTNGRPATVQVKFRSQNNSLLTANQDHLSNFLGASQNKYNVLLEDTKNMLIVTTADGLHHFTNEEMLYKKVRCLGYKDLRKMVDNNGAFWRQFRELCSGWY